MTQQHDTAVAGMRTGTSNTPAVISLVAGILAYLILPLIGAVAAVICGHIGRSRARKGAVGGGMALAGLILGYLQLLAFALLLVFGGFALSAFQDYVVRMRAEQAQEAVTAPLDRAALNRELDDINAGNPTEALDRAKLWVAARLSKGTPLNEVSESLELSAAQKQYWRSIDIRQGTINAIAAEGKMSQPLVLLSMQENGRLVWVCAGEIPAMAQAYCAQ